MVKIDNAENAYRTSSKFPTRSFIIILRKGSAKKAKKGLI